MFSERHINSHFHTSLGLPHPNTCFYFNNSDIRHKVVLFYKDNHQNIKQYEIWCKDAKSIDPTFNVILNLKHLISHGWIKSLCLCENARVRLLWRLVHIRVWTSQLLVVCCIKHLLATLHPWHGLYVLSPVAHFHSLLLQMKTESSGVKIYFILASHRKCLFIIYDFYVKKYCFFMYNNNNNNT